MTKILVALATGFEEIEAITIIDVLRRAGAEVIIGRITTDKEYVKGDKQVTGANNITVIADMLVDEVDVDSLNSIVLPGGKKGAENLAADSTVIKIVQQLSRAGKIVAAICAAPIALAAAGVISGKKVTCYPGFESLLGDAIHDAQPVKVDGNIITGQGPGLALDFSLTLVYKLIDAETSNNLRKGMLVK